jgi:predicted nucleotidyltransferase
MPISPEIQRLVDNLVAGYQPEKVILFGSHAYGTPGPDSDVDLFVIKDDPRPRWERQMEARLTMSTELFGIDVLVYRPNEVTNSKYNALVRDVQTRGIVVYEKLAFAKQKLGTFWAEG